jgi:hypothetical protein
MAMSTAVRATALTAAAVVAIAAESDKSVIAANSAATTQFLRAVAA